MLKEIPHRSCSDAVVEQIITLIKEGQLRPGDKLLSEPELVKVLKVGRSSVREAKQVLAARKVIEIRSGQGSFIRQIQPNEVVDSDVLHLLLAQETLLELQEMREVLEVDLVGLAAQRATQEELDAIAAILVDMKAAENNIQEVFDAGLAFHRALIDATHNQVVVTIYRIVQGLLERFQRPFYTKLSDASTELKEHSAIYRAVKARDGERARRLMRRHLAGVRALTLRGLAQEN